MKNVQRFTSNLRWLSVLPPPPRRVSRAAAAAAEVSSFSSTTYETTTSDYSYEAKLVAPREKSWQDLQACDGCPAKRSTISTKCHITAQPPQALSHRGSGLAWRWRGVSIVPAAERGSQPDPASLPRCAPPRDSAFTIIFRHSLLIKGHGTLIGVVCLSVFFLKLEFLKSGPFFYPQDDWN